MSPERSLCIGVDIGTSACKVAVVDADGEVVAQARVSYRNELPHAGWVEQSPETWESAARTAVAQAVGALTPERRAAVAAMGFAAPTHVAVLTDAHDRVLRPAILWNDQRSAAVAARLEASDGSRIREITGNSPSATWTLAQLAWLREEEPSVVGAISRVWFMKDWVRAAFSHQPEHVTDRIDAQGALLRDRATGTWSAELAALAGIPASALPQVREPDAPAGRVDPGLAEEWGIPADTVLATGTTDTAAELLAAGVVAPGSAAIKLATAGNVAVVAEAPATDARLLSYEHVVPGRHYGNSATSAAAASFGWFADIASVDDDDDAAGRVDAEVEDLGPVDDLPLFLPFLNGERSPRYDGALRAAFVGLTSRHSRAHLAHAVMEGVAFSLKDAASVHPRALPPVVALIGGGARSRTWAQIVAEVLDREVVVVPDGDSARGAALVAAVMVGIHDSADEAATRIRTAAPSVRPDADRVAERALRFGDYLAAAEAITPISHRLSARAAR